jgi:hypothetical protein
MHREDSFFAKTIITRAVTYILNTLIIPCYNRLYFYDLQRMDFFILHK